MQPPLGLLVVIAEIAWKAIATVPLLERAWR
jgi:hypothetical protein